MTRYYRNRRFGRGNTQTGTRNECTNSMRSEPVDPLYDAALKASDARNQLNYAWVADFHPNDKRPGDRERRHLAHYLELIALVGQADKAWRAYRESKGEEYGTRPSNTPADLGWLPRYQERAEQLRLQIRAIEAAESCDALEQAQGI